MTLLKLLLFAVPLAFLFFSNRHAAAVPCTSAGAVLLLWALEPKEPFRLVAWLVTALACCIAIYKGAGMLLLALGAPMLTLVLVEMITRRSKAEDPSQRTLFIGALLLFGLAWFLNGAVAGQKSLGNIRNVVAIGDSLTAGVPGDEVREHWPDILAGRLGGSAVTLAYPGDTAREALDRWRQTVASRRWNPANPAWEPDLFIIVLGGNDIRQSAGPAAVERDIEEWVAALQPAEKPILLVACPGALLTDPYRDAWRNVAARHERVEWMSQEALRSIFSSPRLTLIDHLHFNQAGNEYFADQLHKRINGL